MQWGTKREWKTSQNEVETKEGMRVTALRVTYIIDHHHIGTQTTYATIILFPLRDMLAVICSLRRLDMKLQQLTIFRDTQRREVSDVRGGTGGAGRGRGGKVGR